MAYERILYGKVEPDIVKITMNRPDKRNAQDELMLEEIEAAFVEADLDEEVRVIIFAGAGKDFSTGHDLARLAPTSARDPARLARGPIVGKAVRTKLTGMEMRLKREHYIFFNRCLTMRNVSKPSIAMVQGNCIAGALMDAAMCDLIVASEDARFIDTTVSFTAAGAEVLFHPFDFGFRKAKEMLWTSSIITAQEAQQLGFVSKVVPRENLERETLALARKIAASNPVAVSLIKKSINQAWDEAGLKNALEYHFLIHQLSHSSDEAGRLTEARQAAMAKGEVVEFIKAQTAKVRAAGK